MHVLLAEDNELNIEIAVFVLENAGVTVTKAVNGQDALDQFAASAPGTFDAIIMDVMMPVMDGYQATRAIRQLDRPDAGSIPILAMTANAFVEDRRRAYEAGMNEHLTKPLEPEVVLRTLAKYRSKQQGRPPHRGSLPQKAAQMQLFFAYYHYLVPAIQISRIHLPGHVGQLGAARLARITSHST